MYRALFLMFVLAIQGPAYALENPKELAECKSKNVWDAGYLLRFDLRSYAGDETVTVQTEIYQLVPLWQRRAEYFGPLVQSKLGPCEIAFTDNPDAPSVIVHFRISPAEQDIELEELHGVKPAKFFQLECQPALIERMAQECTTQPN